MRPHLVHNIWSLSVGGDAKNLLALAKLQKAWADVSVLTMLQDPGVRAEELKAAGIRVHSGINTGESMRAWIDEYSPQLAIFHRNGREDQQETQVVESAHATKVPCFEYNTFARVDRTTDHFWLGHAHLSRSSMLQYARRAGESPAALSGHAAIGYAVEIPEPVSREEKALARRALAIDSDKFVVLRLQRADLRKWDPLPVLAVRRLLRQGVKAHLIIMTAPPERSRWVEKTCGANVTLLEQTVEYSKIRRALAASDCLVNYSHIGETFGLALAEGMAHALPVVVNSTPNMDNAQIELCQHESTGLVANSLSALVAALNDLATNHDASKRLGETGRAHIIATYAAPAVEARLRHFMIKRLVSVGSKLSDEIPPASIDQDSYELDQQWIASNEIRSNCQIKAPPAPVRELVDSSILAFLRTIDAADYALRLGPKDLTHTLWRRIKSGSLRRH
jgi:glycosyltransferase involved in cell wall biosynthesis